MLGTDTDIGRCGPYKLGMVLSQCLKRYDGTSAGGLDVPSESVAHENGSQLISELGPRLGLCPPIPFRPKDNSLDDEHPLDADPALPPLKASIGGPQTSQLPTIQEASTDRQVLIVDDNAINRRLLSVFMKKQKLPFKEAKDGLLALEAYKEADGRFDVILMDISM